MKNGLFGLALLACTATVGVNCLVEPSVAYGDSSVQDQIKVLRRKLNSKIKALESRISTAGIPGAPGAKGDKGDRGAPGVSPDAQAVAQQAAALNQPSISATSSRVTTLEQYGQSTIAPQLGYLMQEVPYYAGLGQSILSELTGSTLPAGVPNYFSNSRLDRLEAPPSVFFELNNGQVTDTTQCAIVDLESRGCFSRRGCTITTYILDRSDHPSVNWLGSSTGSGLSAQVAGDSLPVLRIDHQMSALRVPLAGQSSHVQIGRVGDNYVPVVISEAALVTHYGNNEWSFSNFVPDVCFSGTTPKITLNELPAGQNQVTLDMPLLGTLRKYKVFRNNPNGNYLIEIKAN